MKKKKQGKEQRTKNLCKMLAYASKKISCLKNKPSSEKGVREGKAQMIALISKGYCGMHGNYYFFRYFIPLPILDIFAFITML